MSVAPTPGTYPVQQVMPVAPGLVQAVYVADPQRKPTHHPGKLIYSAKMDHDGLKCLYCILTTPFCCGLEEMARNTHLDIYSNALVLSRPAYYPHAADCCFGRQAWGQTIFFDHTGFDEPSSAIRFCRGTCFNLCGYFGKFGDQLNIHNFGCNTCPPRLSGLGHFVLFGCCETIETTYGLAPGEGARVSAIVNEQVRLFRENPTGYPLDIVAASAAQPMMMKPAGV